MISKQHYLESGDTKVIPINSQAVYITMIANGSNAASIEVRKGTSTGDLIIKCTSKQSVQLPAPMFVGTDTLWATVSGTDAVLSISEYVA